MKLFQNKALSLTVTNNPQPPTDSSEPATSKRVDADAIAQIAMYHANHAAALISAVYVGRKVVNTACEIAIIAANKRL